MVTEITSTSWLSRLGSSIKGVLVGLLLIPAAAILLFWNEGRAVNTAKTIDEGEKLCVAAKVDAVEPGNQGKLVHVSGTTKVEGTLADPVFPAASAQAVKLRRQVEMYQWEEKTHTKTEKKTGGSETTTTTYTYEKTWKDALIDSSKFKESGHTNPGSMPYASEEWSAAKVTLGAFTLSDGLVRQIRNWQPLRVGGPAGTEAVEATGAAPAAAAAAAIPARMRIVDGRYYLPVDAGAGTAPAAGASAEAKIGDVRIGFSTVPAGPVSIVSCQTGSTFQPFTASTGKSIDWLRTGIHSAAEMVAMERQDNAMMTWLLRLGGFVAMLMGFGLVLRPLVVVGDFVPFIGSLLGAGAFVISLVISAALSLVMIAVGWIAYRPVAGIGLLVAGVAVFVVGRKLIKGKKKPAAPAPAEMQSVR